MYLFHNVWDGGEHYNKVFIIPLVIVFCTWAMYEKVQSSGLFRTNLAYKILNITVILFFTVTLISLNSYKIITNEIKYVYSDAQNITEKLIESIKKEQKNTVYIGFDHNILMVSGDFYIVPDSDNEPARTLSELADKFHPDFVLTRCGTEIKDYSGYKKIYESKTDMLGSESIIPMHPGRIVFDLYVPDTELR